MEDSSVTAPATGGEAAPLDGRREGGAERRRRQARFVLHERRSGFDRRRLASAGRFERVLLALRDRPPILAGVLVVANFLNLLDFLMTHHALQSGVGEANPLMDGLFSLGPWAAGGFKLLVVGLISLGIWRFRRYRGLLAASVLLLTTYSAVILFQLFGLAVVLG